MIHLLRSRATNAQLDEMLQVQKTFIKLAVDVRRGLLAGGGELHADCEALLLQDGSKQQDIWGADWIPSRQTVEFGAMINIRPKQNNRSYMLSDPTLCKQIERNRQTDI